MRRQEVTCAWVRDAAPEFVLGTLDGVQRADLIEHVAGCAACREDVAALSSSVNDLALLAPEMAPSDDFEARVLTAMTASTRLSLAGQSDQDGTVADSSDSATNGPAAGGGAIEPEASVRWTRARRAWTLAAAAVVVLALVVAGLRIVGDSSSGRAAAPMISADGQRIGESTVVRGSPDVVTVTVSYPFPGTDYSLEGVGDGGAVVRIGTMHLRDGVWRWSGKLKSDAAGVHVLRIVTPSGFVVCQGSFPQ